MKTDSSLNNVAQDILNISVDSKCTIGGLMQRFYSVMEKHNIKQGIEINGGVQRNTPEWVMCLDMFKNRIISQIDIDDLLCINIPKNLQY